MGIKIEIKEEELYSPTIVSQFLIIPQRTVTMADVLEMKIREEVERSDSIKLYRSAEYNVYLQDSLEAFKASFKRNDFVVLIDDLQIETLEQKVTLTDTTIITLLKLVPLVGG